MFLDVVEIIVKSGKGGNGCVAFRREAHVPRGGPAGGDGGRGGNVYLKVAPRMRTLSSFAHKRSFTADAGKHGSGTNKTGKSAKNLTIAVPPGTSVYDVESGELLADLVRPGDRLLAARGGTGGRGNAAFKTPSRQTPMFCEMGERNEIRRLRLELKLIADVGIVGFPNVGKSTLISRISAAKPKIAPYHFTTLEPNLGVVQVGDEFSYVVADVPGLIEGAHEGVGLGHQFLRHVERTRMLVHVVDVASTEGRDPVEDYGAINRELSLHDPRLGELPQIVALNKADVCQDEDLITAMQEAVARDGRRGFVISAVSGQGLDELLKAVGDRLRELLPQVDEFDEEATAPRTFEAPLPAHQALDVRRIERGVYVVTGTEVEQAIERTNLDSRDGVEWLHERLEAMGVLDRLDAMGAGPGDTVFVGDYELQYAG